MAKLIAVFQEKGGRWKSSIAVPYARYSKLPYYTNDRHISLARTLLEGEQIIPLSGEMTLPKKGIFDLAGATDREFVYKLLPFVELWLIPVSDSLMDYVPMMEAIKEIFPGHESKVVFVITGSDKKDAADLREVLQEDFPENAIFTISFSKFVKNMLAEQKSILDYENAGGLAQYLTKKVRGEYKELFKYIDKF